jgi:hypothetical protein
MQGVVKQAGVRVSGFGFRGAGSRAARRCGATSAPLSAEAAVA